MNARQAGVRVQHVLCEFQFFHLTRGHDGPLARKDCIIIQKQLYHALFHHTAYAEPKHQIVRDQFRINARWNGVADAAFKRNGDFVALCCFALRKIPNGGAASCSGFLGDVVNQVVYMQRVPANK